MDCSGVANARVQVFKIQDCMILGQVFGLLQVKDVGDWATKCAGFETMLVFKTFHQYSSRLTLGAFKTFRIVSRTFWRSGRIFRFEDWGFVGLTDADS